MAVDILNMVNVIIKQRLDQRKIDIDSRIDLLTDKLNIELAEQFDYVRQVASDIDFYRESFGLASQNGSSVVTSTVLVADCLPGGIPTLINAQYELTAEMVLSIVIGSLTTFELVGPVVTLGILGALINSSGLILNSKEKCEMVKRKIAQKIVHGDATQSPPLPGLRTTLESNVPQIEKRMTEYFCELKENIEAKLIRVVDSLGAEVEVLLEKKHKIVDQYENGTFDQTEQQIKDCLAAIAAWKKGSSSAL